MYGITDFFLECRQEFPTITHHQKLYIIFFLTNCLIFTQLFKIPSGVFDCVLIFLRLFTLTVQDKLDFPIDFFQSVYALQKIN